MKKCNFEQNTIKVPYGNAWQMLLPLSTAKWRGDNLVTETIDYRALEDIAVFIDGEEYTNWQMTEQGPLVNMPADQFDVGPHNTVLTATYFGVEVKASYFENFTIVQWSFESNVGEHLQDSPLISSPAYIYVGITDDAELEALKQQYRDATAACETARLAYEAAKEEFDEKAEQLDDVAKESTLEIMSDEQIEMFAEIGSMFYNLPTKLYYDGKEWSLDNIYYSSTASAPTSYDIYCSWKNGSEIRFTRVNDTKANRPVYRNDGSGLVLDGLATRVEYAKTNDDIYAALSHISPEDPYSQALAAFFNITTPVPNAVPMTQQEVEDDLDELWNLIITQ